MSESAGFATEALVSTMTFLLARLKTEDMPTPSRGHATRPQVQAILN
jgi:hypothetical protein